MFNRTAERRHAEIATLLRQRITDLEKETERLDRENRELIIKLDAATAQIGITLPEPSPQDLDRAAVNYAINARWGSNPIAASITRTAAAHVIRTHPGITTDRLLHAIDQGEYV